MAELRLCQISDLSEIETTTPPYFSLHEKSNLKKYLA